MSLLSELGDPFRSAAMVAALNTALAAADLPELSAEFGIVPYRHLLGIAAQLPAVAVEASSWRLVSQYSGGEQRIVAPMQVFCAVGADDEADLYELAEGICDVLRATYETQLATTFTRLTCTGQDVRGEPWASDQGVPTRLVRVDFDVEALYQKRTT